jgi:transcriptional regulator with GAF, ATPase, and Fis domain
MATQSSWATEARAVNHCSPFETRDAPSTKLNLVDNEFSGTGLPRIIGESAALRSALGMVRVVAPTGATVLINGETGTGKELIAEAIHKLSDRSYRPFVKVNCAAIPAGLLESEFFGYERGAFTGAVARSIGCFERANRGTLFLDEIGDLPLDLQPKLLRFIQERQFERLGSAATIHTDVRVICATHRDLIEIVNEGKFRADLFYRLNVFHIELPPLRERPEDIRLLVHHFAMNYAARMRKRITTISENFMEALTQHSWPGNIRELQNIIERSIILSTGAVLTGSIPEIPPIDTSKCSKASIPVSHTTGSPGNSGPRSYATTVSTLADAEREHISQAGEMTSGLCSIESYNSFKLSRRPPLRSGGRRIAW